MELYVERPEKARMVGSLYKGVVRKVLPGISAAFVDIGLNQDAFLHFSDVGGGNELVKIAHEMDLEEVEEEGATGKKGHFSESELKPGQEILVQVIKEPIGHKGPRVSTQIALPGRYIVLVPNDTFIGVSRKIANFKEKRRLRQIAQDLRPKGFGMIVRTLAEGKTEEELARDVERVVKVWDSIEKSVRQHKGSGLIYRDISLTSSLIRDLFSPEVGSLVVDSRKLYREIIRYLDEVAPAMKSLVTLYTNTTPIFDHYGIEEEIEKSLKPQIPLPGGGYINIEQTEALVAIDVNSGRYHGKKDHEENALKVNLEAAREICRQLRLRDIGGIIVIDFIDMAEEKHRKMVFEEMRRLMKMDRAKWDMSPIGPFGLMELTRQRIRPALVYSLHETCPHCGGTGLVPSIESVISLIERWIKRFRAQTREHRLLLTVHPKVKEVLSGGVTSRLAHLMWENKLFISLQADESLKISEFKAWSYKQERDVTEDFLIGTNSSVKANEY